MPVTENRMPDNAWTIIEFNRELTEREPETEEELRVERIALEHEMQLYIDIHNEHLESLHTNKEHWSHKLRALVKLVQQEIINKHHETHDDTRT